MAGGRSTRAVDVGGGGIDLPVDGRRGVLLGIASQMPVRTDTVDQRRRGDVTVLIDQIHLQHAIGVYVAGSQVQQAEPNWSSSC